MTFAEQSYQTPEQWVEQIINEVDNELNYMEVENANRT